MRPTKPLILALSFAALLALVVAGCGGGGDDTTESAPTTVEITPLTKAELISQGDAICGETNAAIGALGASEAEVPEQIEKTSDLYIGMVERIKGLGPPEETAGYDEFIAAAGRTLGDRGRSQTRLRTRRHDRPRRSGDQVAPILEEFASHRRRLRLRKLQRRPQRPRPDRLRQRSRQRRSRRRRRRSGSRRTRRRSAARRTAPEEVAPETGGRRGGVEEAAPETGGGTGGYFGWRRAWLRRA